MSQELQVVVLIITATNFTVLTLIALWLVCMRREILERLGHIIEGRRLSMALNLSTSSLRIDPKRFDPNKPELKRLMLAALERWWEERNRVGGWNAASTVLESSGWRQFASPEATYDVRAALSRLMTNGDFETAKAFCEELVDKM